MWEWKKESLMTAVIVAAKLRTSLLYTFSLLLFVFCCTGYVDAADANYTVTPRFAPQFSLGLGAEANANRAPVALGGMLHMDIRFARLFAAGIKGTYSLDFMKLPEYSFAEDTLIEGDALFRWYALSKAWKPRGDKTGGETAIFLQAEAGVALGETHFAWDDAFMPKFNIGGLTSALSGGIAAGVRFTFPNNLYLEPYGRFGYPYTWSGGIALGYTFRKKPQPVASTPSQPDSEYVASMPSQATPEPVASMPPPAPEPVAQQNPTPVASMPPQPLIQFAPEPIAQQNPAPVVSGELPDAPLVLRIWRETLVPIARPYPPPVYTPYPPPGYGYPAPSVRRYPVPVYPLFN
jgi:hypothetical protein